ncbi:cupin domain-containing protein [Anaerotignum sp. MB30-C6]|uniref:cupin domain-containing protein n=1 Tax=Anaerotignum sp. MB30-C6 TaxID=3070814 RepID=UPI0027DE9E17|nr:cupin domain-containing protein [Anaerotignum sp. MB30-C6]WMI82059.1 cupin domain-containing protein [Anaerotignum sp. MB30-C6]
MVRKARVVTVEGLRDGKGTVEIHHFLEKEELLGHCGMYARVILKPHSSIGWHQHVGNTEPYAIIKGEGTFIDNDGSKTTVHPGDVCLIEVGQWHSIENNTDEDMEMIALIINEEAK